MPGLMPPAEPDPPRSPLVSTITPTNPTASPARRFTVMCSSCRNSGAITIVNSGTVELRIAATEESTPLPSPYVMSQNGITMENSAMTSRWPYVRRLVGSAGRTTRKTRGQQERPEQEPQHDQRERSKALVDADLDEQVAAAPHERQEDEQRPVEPGPGGLRRGGDGLRGTLGRHRPDDKPRWPIGLGQKRAGAPG